MSFRKCLLSKETGNRLRIIQMARTGFVINTVGILKVTIVSYFLGGMVLGINGPVFLIGQCNTNPYIKACKDQ